MNSRHLNRELLTGLLLLMAGATGFFFGGEETNSATTAGRFFSRAVLAGLMATGTGIALRSFIRPRERFAAIPLRSCTAVTAAVLAFAALIEKAGLAAAVVSAIMLATLGSRTPRLWAGFVFGVCFAAAMYVLFVGLLGQSIRLAPGF